MWHPWRRSKAHTQDQTANGDVEGVAASAEERVRRFQHDFNVQWKASLRPRAKIEAHGERFFPVWREMMAPIEQRHFDPASEPGLGNSLSSRAEYGESAEAYVRSERVGDGIRVLYQKLDGIGGKFREYVVHEQGDDFKIVSILIHYSDPVLPFLDREKILERQSECAADAPLEDLFDCDLLLDHNQNYTNREVQYRDGTDGRAVVEQIATLTTSSGAISVWDYGWDNDDARPLARTVTPGSYRVERVTAFDRNASVRVLFSEELAVTWRPAQCEAGGRDTVGVDAGCICIVDYSAYASMTPREKALVFDEFNDSPRPAAQQFVMSGGDTGVACESGFGDGAYQMYWGLDAQERVVQLVVDFWVLLTEVDGKYTHI